MSRATCTTANEDLTTCGAPARLYRVDFDDRLRGSVLNGVGYLCERHAAECMYRPVNPADPDYPDIVKALREAAR